MFGSGRPSLGPLDPLDSIVVSKALPILMRLLCKSLRGDPCGQMALLRAWGTTRLRGPCLNMRRNTSVCPNGTALYMGHRPSVRAANKSPKHTHDDLQKTGKRALLQRTAFECGSAKARQSTNTCKGKNNHAENIFQPDGSHGMCVCVCSEARARSTCGLQRDPRAHGRPRVPCSRIPRWRIDLVLRFEQCALLLGLA